MSLDGTYAGLQASIAGWLHRSDLTTVIPDLVVLAEARIARELRLRRQVVSSSLATTAGVQSIALPSDYLEAENLSVVNAGVDTQIIYVNIEHLNVKYPAGAGDGVPAVYTFEANNILFGPRPDGIYTVNFYYYQRWPALALTPTNWLLTYHPNVYLFGALAEAADYAQSDNISKWEQKYTAGVKTLQTTDDNSMFSGSALRVRRI